MRWPLLFLAILTLIFAFALKGANAQSADDRIGLIKSATGNVWLTRSGDKSPAKPGDPVFVTDRVDVDPAGSASVVLLDGTSLSIGGASTVWLDEFAYEPQNDALGMLIRLVRGSMLFVTGEIGKLAPSRIQIETPSGTLGVRGTRFVVRTAQ